MLETQVRSLGQDDPLEKEMATRSSTLAWKIPWTEESGRLQSMGLQRVRHNWATWLYFKPLLYRSEKYPKYLSYPVEFSIFVQIQSKRFYIFVLNSQRNFIFYQLNKKIQHWIDKSLLLCLLLWINSYILVNFKAIKALWGGKLFFCFCCSSPSQKLLSE